MWKLILLALAKCGCVFNSSCMHKHTDTTDSSCLEISCDKKGTDSPVVKEPP